MRIFRCDRCGGTVAFNADRCPTCAAMLGYLPEERTICVLSATADAAVYAAGDAGPLVWRCLNTAWGCNWLAPVSFGNEWCRSCQLTRGRPDMSVPQAVDAWMVAERAKRHLVHQLVDLGLPIQTRSPDAPDGLAFDLVYLPGEGGITGHLDGLVTLDLTEADESHRDELRRRLGEPFRTVIGHLRHEIAHHYWGRLVGGSADDLERLRARFDDDRLDYAEAIDRYYAGQTPPWDPSRYVSPYATAHPLEDWAETFAHYLHIVDVTDTAAAHGLVAPARPADGASFDDLIAVWRPLDAGLDAIADSLGARPLFPFDPAGAALDKMAFVHERIAAVATSDTR